MKCSEIHIRDPYILCEDGKYYMYGTRAANFGKLTGGFDVYVSTDLENWSDPIECFDSVKHNLNKFVNWAPEVHRYNGAYYMFATFTQENELKATYILKADSPLGPFVPHSDGPVTPTDWQSLDGTLYISKAGIPYVVFCHEHAQIIDGTICYAQLDETLTHTVAEPVTMFAASACPWVDKHEPTGHYVTDGCFLYRTKTGELMMIWSSFIKGKYAELLARFDGGEIGTNITHLPPLLDNDGGHGMIFQAEGKLYLTFHSPNQKGYERPAFTEITDTGDSFATIR